MNFPFFEIFFTKLYSKGVIVLAYKGVDMGNCIVYIEKRATYRDKS